MKSMKIAASGELVSCLSTHRQVVSLDGTDFTDVAAVVITVADSRSGILALLKRTGFHLPVFIFSEVTVELPAGAEAVIGGNAQDWLELESAACRYEDDLLPPFYDTLTQYVEMGNSTFACPCHQHGEFLRNILPDGIFMSSLARICFARICAMQTSSWAICSFMRGRQSMRRSLRQKCLMQIKHTLC